MPDIVFSLLVPLDDLICNMIVVKPSRHAASLKHLQCHSQVARSPKCYKHGLLTSLESNLWGWLNSQTPHGISQQ